MIKIINSSILLFSNFNKLIMAGTELCTNYAHNVFFLGENLANEILSEATEQVEAIQGNNHVANRNDHIGIVSDIHVPTGPVTNPTIS